jgi:hypothetical protein
MSSSEEDKEVEESSMEINTDTWLLIVAFGALVISGIYWLLQSAGNQKDIWNTFFGTSEGFGEVQQQYTEPMMQQQQLYPGPMMQQQYPEPMMQQQSYPEPMMQQQSYPEPMMQQQYPKPMMQQQQSYPESMMQQQQLPSVGPQIQYTKKGGFVGSYMNN